MTFLEDLIKSEEELQKFLKEYDEHIGLKHRPEPEPETKLKFGVKYEK